MGLWVRNGGGALNIYIYLVVKLLRSFSGYQASSELFRLSSFFGAFLVFKFLRSFSGYQAFLRAFQII
jgi:hypothetical protein